MAAAPEARRPGSLPSARGLLRRAAGRVLRWLEPPPANTPARAPVVAATSSPACTSAPAPSPPRWRDHVLGHGNKWATRVGSDDELGAAESTRRLRVAIRRIRAMSRALGVVAEDAPPVDRGLRRLARRLGVLRDLDLVVEHCAAAHALAGDAIDRAALEELGGWLAHRRGQALARADALRNDDDIAGELALFTAALEHRADDESRARELAELALVRLGGALAAAAETELADHQLEQLHELRIAARRFRYAAELFEPQLDGMQRELLARARDVQRTIGAHRDAAAWHELLGERITRADARGRITLSRGLQRAWLGSGRARARSFAAVGPALARLRDVLPNP